MTILVGDNRVTLAGLETGYVQCIATSPPYFGLRLYGDSGKEIGKERALEEYVSSLVDVMRECRRVLRDDGVAWVNLGDSYAGSGGSGGRESSGLKTGDLTTAKLSSHSKQNKTTGNHGNALMVPFRVAAALQSDGWTLRAMLPWVKIAAMPESVQSRPCISHEYVLFLTKRPSGYFYDADAVRVAHARLWGENNGGTMAHNGSEEQAAARDGRRGQGNAHRGEYPLPHPAGRSLRSSDFWREGARAAGEALIAAADGQAIGMITNDDHPAAFMVNPKGSGIPHFAMWPAKLVAPMIKAGSPEAGSCSVCGAPWERVVGVERLRAAPPSGNREVRRWTEQRDVGAVGGRMVRASLGFRPSCAHDAPSRPAVILDPFAGAGTTLAVAECLGRTAIGCELYQKNADLYPERLSIIRKEMGWKGSAVEPISKQTTIPGFDHV